MEQLTTFCAAKPRGESSVVAILEFLLSFYNSEGFNGCWCLRTVAEVPPENEKIRSVIREQKTGLLQFINDVIRKNMPELKTEEQDRLAHRTYLLYEGAIGESHLYNDSWPIEEGITLLKELCKAR